MKQFVKGCVLICTGVTSIGAYAQYVLPDTAAPGYIPVYPPAVRTPRPALARGVADPVPELLHYKFEGTGLNVPNLASSPPAGTATAVIQGAVTQTGADLNSAGNGFSLSGSGATSTTDYLNTGWATAFSGSWTISFASAQFGPSTTLYYVFGDSTASSFRCFTNGVAGANNWILRGTGMTDVLVTGAATLDKHRTTFVYDAPNGAIRAYLDGVLVNTVAQPSTLTFSSNGPFKVMGYAANVGAPTGGLLDDVRVYSRALTAEEVASIDPAPDPVFRNGFED